MTTHSFTLLSLVVLAITQPSTIAAADVPATTAVTSLDGSWSLAVDPKNVGREEQWFDKPAAEAKQTTVPWIIQDAFPGYHGVAWYWRDFAAPANPHADGRYFLRFWQVDYYAEVWLNGVKVGQHEGGEDPFELDVTDAIHPTADNRLAVRVLNPTDTPIDGMTLGQTPHRNKVMGYGSGSSYNHGGIVDSVELLVSAPLRIKDLFLRPDPKSGVTRIQATVANAQKKAVDGRFSFAVAPAASGETIGVATLARSLPPGETVVETEIQVANPRFWQLNDPFLYRVSARLAADGSASVNERSARCGFRDFRFEDGYFRLNGRRIFLRCSHTGNHCPIGLEMPHDPDLLRRDLLNCKAMGFNAIRFISGVAKRYQLDLCDEIGLMVYEGNYAGWCLEDSPKMAERFDAATAGMIRSDRNHPSIVMWEVLNETGDGPVFRHALTVLPMVRSLDDTRLVMLNSGRFDNAAIGSLSNPGSSQWEDVLHDQHRYLPAPQTNWVIGQLRTLAKGSQSVFLSEFGVGSGVDLVRVARHYEQLGKEYVEDARFYRDKLDRFLADWKAWNMAECFAQPEDFFRQSLTMMAEERLLGLNAIRANPHMVGFSLTGTVDQGMSGEGLTTTFRDLKPGTVDAMFDGWYPLRWCLFAEPVNVYRGTSVRLEAVLANEDALTPGEYPVRLLVVGPNCKRVFERTLTISVPDSNKKPEPAFAMPVFKEDIPIDGPSGKYRFLVTFERGGAAAGGETAFYVADPADMPAVEAEVTLWGDDAPLADWLAKRAIRTRPFSATAPGGREVILVGRKAQAEPEKAFPELARRIAQGSTAVFLAPEVFLRGDKLGWTPLKNKGAVQSIGGSLYHKDEWAKGHPIFDGLPSGGLMDWVFYRDIIPDPVWVGLDPPAEAVAGANNVACNYGSGLTVSVHILGDGRFVLNTLQIADNLGVNPVAERLLRNMLNYAARGAAKPVAELPADFDEQLKALGY